MDKQALKETLLESIDEEIKAATAASTSAQEAASHEDNQPENQYDTLALEAAYLAHGQSERILKLQESRIALEKWHCPNLQSDDSIRLGAYVQLVSENDVEDYVFLSIIGGRHIEFDGKKITLVSMETPLAKALAGCYEGDELTLTLGGQHQRWEVVSIA